MEEWKIYRLGDLVDFQNGYAFKSSKFLYDGKYKIIRIKELKNGLVKFFEDTVSISDEPNEILSKILVNKGDVIFALTGDPVSKQNANSWVGRVSLYTHDIPAYLNQRTCKIIQCNNVVPQYVYYYFRQYENLYSLASKATGSASQANISTKILEDTEILLPSLSVQKKMVAILASLDNKIALNRRINDNLEQQAQALFDYYFSADSKYLSDSERGVLTNIAVYLNGLAMQKFPPTDSEHSLPVLKIKELGQGKCDNNSDRCSNDIDSNYVIDNGNIIFSWSGTLMVDVWCGGKCGLNQHLFKVTPLQDYPQWFIYYWTIRHLNTFKLIAKDKAVTMGHIKRVDLEKAEVIIPNKYSLVEMNAQIEPLYQSIINNRLQIAELETLRDALLPKLMSGELKINDLNC